MEGKEVFGGTVDWPGDQEGVCWPKPESLAGGARGQLLGPSSSGFLLKPLTCLQLPPESVMPDCLWTKPVFSSLQWVASIDVQENEEASANVVVKMTDSFTEQADQVIPGKHCTWGGEPWGEGSTGGVFSFFQMLFP